MKLRSEVKVVKRGRGVIEENGRSDDHRARRYRPIHRLLDKGEEGLETARFEENNVLHNQISRSVAWELDIVK